MKKKFLWMSLLLCVMAHSVRAQTTLASVTISRVDWQANREDRIHYSARWASPVAGAYVRVRLYSRWRLIGKRREERFPSPIATDSYFSPTGFLRGSTIVAERLPLLMEDVGNDPTRCERQHLLTLTIYDADAQEVQTVTSAWTAWR